MITPKTDWKDGDYFQMEDYNRIISNLNELAGKYGITQRLSAGSHSTILTNQMALDIAEQFDEIMSKLGYGLQITESLNGLWFGADVLNTIETGCLMASQDQPDAEYSAGLIYDTGATYGGGALG